MAIYFRESIPLAENLVACEKKIEPHHEKNDFYLWENKCPDQLADQCLCFCYIDNAIPVLPRSKISSF